MLEQPIAREPPSGPETWVVLATERRRDNNASIFALNGYGRPEKKPEKYALFGSRADALAWLDGDSVSLDHAAWTYTAFQMS